MSCESRLFAINTGECLKEDFECDLLLIYLAITAYESEFAKVRGYITKLLIIGYFP